MCVCLCYLDGTRQGKNGSHHWEKPKNVFWKRVRRRGETAAAVFHSSLLLCGRMGAGALTICVSTNPPEASQSFTLFPCPEEPRKSRSLFKRALRLRDSCFVSFSSPGEVTSDRACFHSNRLDSSEVSPHWAAVAPGSLPPVVPVTTHMGTEEGEEGEGLGEGGGHMLGLAIFFISLWKQAGRQPCWCLGLIFLKGKAVNTLP